MKSLGSIKSKIARDENDENVSHLEITEVLLVHFNISTKIINMIPESCIHLFPIDPLINYHVFHLNGFIFLTTFNSKFSYIDIWFTDQNS